MSKTDRSIFLRPGMTETTCMFVEYLHSINEQSSLIPGKNAAEKIWRNREWSCRWLYNCCGLYDKSIDIHTENEKNLKQILESEPYNIWLNRYKKALSKTDAGIMLLQPIGKVEHIQDFIEKNNNILTIKQRIKKEKWKVMNVNRPYIHDTFDKIYEHPHRWAYFLQDLIKQYIKGKKILIVGNTGEICTKKYTDNKNIRDHLSIKSIDYIDYPSCFGNSGDDDNHIVTQDRIVKKINDCKHNYDVVLLSCGANAVCIAGEISDDINVLSVGSSIQYLFEIKPVDMSPPNPEILNVPIDIRVDLSRYFGKSILCQ